MATAMGQGTEGKTKQVETMFKTRQLQHKRRELPCRFRICKFLSCESWHPPVCQKKEVKMATNVIIDMLRE